MAWLFSDLQKNPDLLKPCSREGRKDLVAVLCSRCGKEHNKTKDVLFQALSQGRTGIYCTRSCSALRQADKWQSSEGLSRQCRTCGQTKPKDKFFHQQGHTCNTCEAQKPRFRWRSYQGRAQKSGISFTLTYEQFIRHWQKPCSYCDTPIDTIGLDRVDNALGYADSNVVPCCRHCNWMKGEGTLAEFVARCQRIARGHAC